MAGKAQKSDTVRLRRTRTDIREALLQSALVEFGTKGFDGASTRAIARRVEAYQPQINYHFESKTVLWTAAVDYLFGLLREALDGVIPTDLTGVDVSQLGTAFADLHVILSILGLPEADFPRMLQLTRELFGGDDDELNRSRDTEEQMAVLLDFFDYFVALTADRRANPTDDLASVVANATIDGQVLNDFDAASYYVIIATAGHDTTSSSIAGGLEALGLLRGVACPRR
jgi:AcrR family transcriptional regulator